jgi:hypothetical protein
MYFVWSLLYRISPKYVPPVQFVSLFHKMQLDLLSCNLSYQIRTSSGISNIFHVTFLQEFVIYNKLPQNKNGDYPNHTKSN